MPKRRERENIQSTPTQLFVSEHRFLSWGKKSQIPADVQSSTAPAVMWWRMEGNAVKLDCRISLRLSLLVTNPTFGPVKVIP